MNTQEFLLLAVIVGIFALTALTGLMKQTISVYTNPEAQKDTIDVTATATVYSNPDKANIYLGVETQKETALASQQENANLISAVKNAIINKGVSSGDIETNSYNVELIRDYSEKGDQKIIAYKTIHILKIKLTDMQKAGAVIDAAVGAGANRVDSVQFDLTDAKADQLREQALSQAMDTAKGKATAIASKAGVMIKKLSHVSESYYTTNPYYYESSAVAGVQAPTDISPKEVSVTASLSVSYEFT